MTTQEQDKLWDELSEESKTLLIEQYNSYGLNDTANVASRRTMEETFGSHNLNPKPLTYEDVANKLFGKNNEKQNGTFCCPIFSEGHCSKISAINALINVAKYLNGDWKPDWDDETEDKWYMQILGNKIDIDYTLNCNSRMVYFRTKELAQQAIQILGEETIRLALSTDY